MSLLSRQLVNCKGFVPEGLDEAGDHEVLPESRDLGDIVKQSDHFGLDPEVPREGFENLEVEIHPVFI